MGRWFSEGLRYWPIVRMSTSWSRRSRMVSQSHHKAALGKPFGIDLLDVAQDLQRPLVLGLRPYRRVQARHGLDVVVERVGPGVYERPYRVPVSLEVGGKHLDGAAGDLLPYLPDGLREDGRPAVLELVAVHAGDNGVLEAHLSGGVGHAIGLVEVELAGLAGEDVAEAARAR